MFHSKLKYVIITILSILERLLIDRGVWELYL